MNNIEDFIITCENLMINEDEIANEGIVGGIVVGSFLMPYIIFMVYGTIATKEQNKKLLHIYPNIHHNDKNILKAKFVRIQREKINDGLKILNELKPISDKFNNTFLSNLNKFIDEDGYSLESVDQKLIGDTNKNLIKIKIELEILYKSISQKKYDNNYVEATQEERNEVNKILNLVSSIAKTASYGTFDEYEEMLPKQLRANINIVHRMITKILTFCTMPIKVQVKGKKIVE